MRAAKAEGDSKVPNRMNDANNRFFFMLISYYSTFANGEVKEFKEVREVKAICFTDRYSNKKAVGYNF